MENKKEKTEDAALQNDWQLAEKKESEQAATTGNDLRSAEADGYGTEEAEKMHDVRTHDRLTGNINKA